MPVLNTSAWSRLVRERPSWPSSPSPALLPTPVSARLLPDGKNQNTTSEDRTGRRGASIASSLAFSSPSSSSSSSPAPSSAASALGLPVPGFACPLDAPKSRALCLRLPASDYLLLLLLLLAAIGRLCCQSSTFIPGTPVRTSCFCFFPASCCACLLLLSLCSAFLVRRLVFDRTCPIRTI